MRGRARGDRLFEEVFRRHGGLCAYCGGRTRRLRAGLHAAPDRATLDHVVPRSRGGRLDAGNLVLACLACNNERGTLDAEEFRRRKAAGPGETP